MASKNSIKFYIPNSYYHVYNRGVEKRNIFLDAQDYSVFLSYLATYLLPKDVQQLQSVLFSTQSSPREKDIAVKLLHLKNYHQEIELISYALLPNHFHLLLWQKDDALKSFMSSIGTRYGMYFNRKYKRKGVLFQDVYKAVSVATDEQLLHLTTYIHHNPSRWAGIPIGRWKEVSYPSSLPEFLGFRRTTWVHPERVLAFFKKDPRDYASFVGADLDIDRIADLTIDEE